MLSPGDVLNGRYRLTQRIAAGGMGEVWRGEDLLLQRDIAVKVLLPALMSDADFITRFRSEARMMAALRHPGIVQVYDYGENAQVGAHRLDFLVMEYIEGTPLSKRIQQAGRLSPADTMTMIAQVASALQAAHEAGIIHRDVKPSNLLVRPAGAIVLVDFGVARSVGVTGITSTNVVLGSAHYMAPEQAEGRPVTAATDVYAVGAVAFSCLTGRPPYVGDNPLAVLAQLVHGQPPVLPPDVPGPVAAVVMRALAKDPVHRFPSAAALAAAAVSPPGRPLSGRASGPAAGMTGATGRPGVGAAPGGSFPGGSPTGGSFPGGSPTGSHPAGAGPAGTFAGGPPHGFAPGSASASGSGSAGMNRGGFTPGSASVGHGFAAGTASGGAVGHGFAAGTASGGAVGHGFAAGTAPGGAVGHGFAAGTAPGGAVGHGFAGGSPGGARANAPGDVTATSSVRRRNSTVALAAVAVVALLAGVGIILGNQADKTEPVIESQDSGPQSDQLQQDASTGKPRGQVTARPGKTKGGSATETTPPAGEVPVTGPDTTGQPTATATTDPDETDDPSATDPVTNPHNDPVNLCGSGYQVINSKNLETSAGVLRGTIYLLYRASGGKNCVVTIKENTLDVKTSMSATLEVQGSGQVTDKGSFQYYAGPVSAAAPQTCVKWGGSIGGLSYESDFSHCN
ncbi:serine/threonine-protein kinase [Actinoplanes subglobosus]|uniref:non-specific serine/threonine protein kinase n=1 Tax=Actinoplanes subglobosus TaxID=1547892 RepID=A0ABV8IXW6_9ACTN